MEQILEPPVLTLRQRLKSPVYTILSDDVMMALAVLLVPAILLPYVATFSPTMLLFFDAVNYFVIGAFVVEYVLKIYVADSRKEYILDPWHILDLIVIVLAFTDIIPFIQFAGGRVSPLLRLLRLIRALFVTGRTVQRATPSHKKIKIMPAGKIMAIKAFDGSKIKTYGPNEKIDDIVKDPTSVWIDVQNATSDDVPAIAAALKMPDYQIDSKLIDESFPRIDFLNGRTTVFIRDVRLLTRDVEAMYKTMPRAGVLLICSGDRIFTLAKEKNDLMERLAGKSLPFEGDPMAARIFCQIMDEKMHDYEEITHYFEEKLAILEDVPVKSMRAGFLDECFYLKKDIGRFHNTLKHFKQLLEQLRHYKPALNGIEERHLAIFKNYYFETEYIHEIVETVRDTLMSLIELHINTVSFDINRVMRVLALITVLGIIPSMAFGFLGAGLKDAPFPVTSTELVIIVGTVMFLGLFVFYKAGWLK